MPTNPITFVDGAVLTAAQLNTENNTIYNAFNNHNHDGVQGEPTTLNPSIINISSAFRVNSSGILEYGGANTPGFVSNLGISLAAGVFSVVDAQGDTLSSSNPGYVTVPSTTGGQYVTLKVSVAHTFNDDSHASSSLTNLGWGITEAADWANDMPFFLYVVNRANSDLAGTDGSSMFFIARHPCMTTTPSSANDIGDVGAIPTNDSQDVILILKDVTVANYVSLPCQLVGGFRMQWSTTTDDWTVQTLGNTDGVGAVQLSKHFGKRWTFPAGQNGAVSGRYMLLNGGTSVPQWSTQTYYYIVNPNGTVWVTFEFDGDGGTDGVGAVNAHVVVPYMINTDHASNVVFGLARATGSGIAANGHSIRGADLNSFVNFTDLGGASGSVLDINNFGAGGRSLGASFTYPAFVV